MNSINPIQGGRPPAGVPPQHQQSLTLDQLDTVSSILLEYDSESLSSEDAEAIREDFREAGIRPSQDLRKVLEESGFDADAIRGIEQGPPPPPPPSGGQSLGSLEQLKEILSQYDLTNLDSDGQASLISELQATGLLQSGLYINISV